MATKTITKEEIIEYIKAAPALEINELVKAIETTFGITAVAAVSATTSATKEEADDKPKTVSVLLTSAGLSKLAVIKKIKEITGKELKDAKVISDNANEKAPQVLAKDLDGEKAQTMKKEFEALGATVVVE